MGPYAYIAIEGNIGAGKTTFTELVAKQYGYELILERFEENPFLERFYEDPKSHAFSVELAFVADRFKQLREALGSRNLFRQQVLADYSFAKSLIFALDRPILALNRSILALSRPILSKATASTTPVAATNRTPMTKLVTG